MAGFSFEQMSKCCLDVGKSLRDGIQAIILGGTELPLLFRNGPAPSVPFLDTTRLHVERAVAYLLGRAA